MLMRHKHFHYGIARSIIVILLLLLGLYGVTLYSPGLKLFLASQLGIPPKVLGVTDEKKDPKEQLKSDLTSQVDAIKKQEVKLEDVTDTLSRSKKIPSDLWDMATYALDQIKHIPLPKAPKE